MEKKHDSLYVSTLARGLQILRAFDESHISLSLTDLVARTGLEKSAVQRMAHTLHLEGMLERDPKTRHFRPSHAWLELAYAYYWSDPIIARALPKLIEFSQAKGETINLAQISGDHIIYSLRLPNQRTHFAASIVGRRLPALNTAAGRVMLSTRSDAEIAYACANWPLVQATRKTLMDRDEIARNVRSAREDGYCIARDQMLLNEISLATTVTGTDGQAHAAVQISLSGITFDEKQVLEKFLPTLLDTAAGILG
ncbi:IclR family transcriptional regulator [Phaeobacter sp. 22II1-1F12B]|uniref:IclR family transcriptional regulator n=1 Tax=Phaeobacter sp. 22II1-1F12B TaxID=1317111 RepID=UPI000B52530B|nr:IclR family transcriptional regulator [Phaeobacter sp. 22II1-1F12B]OWU75453.1 IclR family transcriptional regulator [Phaeobacter sp. 22II1-1F12B]